MGGVADLAVRITAQMDEFNKGVQSMGDKLQSLGGKMTNAGATLSKGLTVPVLAAVGGIFALTQKFANAGDEIQKMAQRTGLSTEAISELKHAAELSGTTIESLETGFKRMQSTIYDAGQGMGTAVDAFESLGLSVEQVQGLNPEEQFDILTTALAGVEDASTRAALAQDIFGRAGTDMLPMLSEGAEGLAAMRAEAHDLGIVFDQEAADKAAQFNDDMLRLKQGVGGVFQELAMKLMPVFVDQLIPALQENIIPLAQTLADKISAVIEWFANLSPTTQKVVGIIIALAVALGPVLMFAGMMVSAIGALVPVFAALLGPVGLVIAIIAALIAIGVLLYKNWDEIKAKAIEIWTSVKEFFVNIFGSIKDFFVNIWEEIKSIFSGAGKDSESVIVRYYTAIFDFIKDIWNKVVDFYRNIWEAIKALFRGDSEAVKEHLMKNYGAIFEFIQDIWNKIRDFFADIWIKVKEVFSSSLSDIWEAIKKAFWACVDFVVNFGPNVVNAVKGIWETVNDYMNGLPEKMLQFGKDIIQGLINGIKNMAAAAWEAVTGVVGGVIGKAKSLLKSSSPSKVFMEIGEGIGQGLEQGIDAMHKSVGVSMQNIVTPPNMAMAGGGSMAGGAVSNSGGYTFIIELDGRQIGKSVFKHLPGEVRIKTGLRN